MSETAQEGLEHNRHSYPKRGICAAHGLEPEEVAQLIDAGLTPYHRTLLMTLYSTGGGVPS